MNQDDARRILADKPFMPAAGETPTDYSSRVDAFQRDDAERADKERQKAQKAADAAAQKAENERAAAIRRTASEDAKNTKTFVEDVFKPKEAELSTKKAEIEDQWRKDEEAAKPRVFGLLGPDPAAESRLPQHAQEWQKTQDELDKWTTGTQELEKRTRSLVARKDAMDDVEYAEDQEKITGSTEEKSRALNSAIQKRLSPDAPADYQENYRDEMKRKGYELTDTKPDTSGAQSGATQPEQAPSAGQDDGQGPDLKPKSKALELAVAQKLEKDVLAGRAAILNEDLRAQIDKNEWRTLTKEQKAAKVAEIHAARQAKLDAYDAQQAGMSPERQAIIEGARGTAPVTDVAAEAVQETGRRAAQAGVAIYKGVQDVTLGAVDTLSFVEAAARGVKPEETNTHVFAQGARQQTEEWMGANPEENGVASLAQGIGSSMAFLPAGVFGGIPGVLIAGAAQGFGPGYYDAKEIARQNGVEITEQQAYMRALIAAGLGTTEALPISRAFDRLDKMTGGALKVLIDPLKEAGEEFIQEFGQNVIQDAYDKITGLNDKAWTKILGDGFDAGKIAAVSGLLMGITMNAAAQHDWKKRYTDRAEVLTNLDENTKHMTADAVYTKGAEAMNLKNDRLLELRDTLGTLEGQITPTTEETERKRIQSEIDAARKELADIEVTPETIRIAADMTTGTTAKFSTNEAEVSRLRAEMEALRPAKGTFWNPTNYEKLTRTQEELTIRLTEREDLYKAEHTEEENARFRSVLGAAKDISKFPDAPSDPDGNGKSPGSSQRAIMTAIWKVANGQTLTPAELDLKAGKSGRVFKVDNKTGTVQVANDYIATQMQTYRAQLEAAAQGQPITNQVLAAYEKASQQPQPVVRPVQAQEGTPAQTQWQPAADPATGSSSRTVQASPAAPGLFRVGVSSTMNGQPVSGAGTVDVEAFTEDEAVAKVVSGEVVGPTVTGNQQFAVHQVVRAPVEAVYAEEAQPEQAGPQAAAEPEVDAAAAIEEAKKATSQIVERLMPLFKGVNYIYDPNVSSGGMIYRAGGILEINAAMLDLSNKERVRRVAIEEAIHAALVTAKIDTAAIWKAITDEKTQIALFEAYPSLFFEGQTDYSRGHEFMRLFLQKKINFTADGRLMWDDNGNFKTSEEAARDVNLIQKVRDAVRKIVDYLESVLNGITDTDANKEIKRAYDVAKERFEWLAKITANEQQAPPKAAEQPAGEVSEPGSAAQAAGTPAAEQPAEVGTPAPEQEPVAQEATPPPKGNVAALERKLSEKAFQSVNVPNEQFAAYLQGRADSQKAGTKPLSDKDITALFEYYYAKGDEARMDILDAEMARRAQEEDANQAQEEMDRTAVDLGEKIRGKIRRTGNPKQEQGEIDHMLDGWDTFTKAQKERVRKIFVGGEAKGLPTLDILRDNLSSEGIKFDTIHKMLEAVGEYITTGSYGDADIFSQAVTPQQWNASAESRTMPDVLNFITEFSAMDSKDPATLAKLETMGSSKRKHIADAHAWRITKKDGAQQLLSRKKILEWFDMTGATAADRLAEKSAGPIKQMAEEAGIPTANQNRRTTIEALLAFNRISRERLAEFTSKAAFTLKYAPGIKEGKPMNADLAARFDLERIARENYGYTQSGNLLVKTDAAFEINGKRYSQEEINERLTSATDTLVAFDAQSDAMQAELLDLAKKNGGRIVPADKAKALEEAQLTIEYKTKDIESLKDNERHQEYVDSMKKQLADARDERQRLDQELAPDLEAIGFEGIQRMTFLDRVLKTRKTMRPKMLENIQNIKDSIAAGQKTTRIDTQPKEGQLGLFSQPGRTYESMEFSPPFQTSRGEILTYNWMNDGRSSDWTQAKTNPETGREIVHHFKMRSPKGDVMTVSLETAMGALSADRRKKLTNIIDSEMQRRRDSAAGQGMLFSQAAPVTTTNLKAIKAANKPVRFANGTILVPPDLASQRAYHGTPHKVDRFSLDKIGTGEGAQAYGWGLYFAESKEVAENYRRMLGASKGYERIAGTNSGLTMRVMDYLDNLRKNNHPVRYLQESLDAGDFDNIRQEERDALQAYVNSAKEGHPNLDGNTYSVDIDAEPDELLDWDKTTDQRDADAFKAALGKTQVVKLSADSFGITRILPDGSGNLIQGINRATAAEAQAELDGLFFGISGEGSYNMLQSLLGASPKATSEALREQGIPGIRYLDQGSRRRTDEQIKSHIADVEESIARWENENNTTEQGRDLMLKSKREELQALNRELANPQTYNYVIFDEARIKITAENDVALASQAIPTEEITEIRRLVKEMTGEPEAAYKFGNAWLTQEGKWINVFAHRDAIPEEYFDGKPWYTEEMSAYEPMMAAGFMRVVRGYDAGGSTMYVDYDRITNAQRREIKNTVAELGWRLYEDVTRRRNGNLFSQNPAEHPAQAAQLILDFDAAPKPASVPQAALATNDEDRDLAMRRRDAVPLTPEQAKTVEANMGLAGMVANRAVGFGWDRDDAMQEASIALMRAVRTFDEARGIKFSTFATQVMTRHLISVNAKAGNRNARNATSLDETISEDDGDTTKKDMIAQDVGRFTERPDEDGIRIVAEVLASIPPRVQAMLRKYGAGMTQEEIAEELGISRQAVGKAIANGAEAMRKRLEARGITRTLDIFPERGQTAPTMMQPSRPTTDDESDSEVIDPREGDRMRDAEAEQDLGSQTDEQINARVLPRLASYDRPLFRAALIIRAELSKALPNTKLRYNKGNERWTFTVDAGEHVNDLGNIDTIGGGEHTGVALRIALDSETRTPYATVAEINVSKSKQKTGLATKILEAISKGGIPVYHSADFSEGFWEHIKATRPDLFNRTDGSLGSQPVRATFETVTPEQARAELGRAQPDEALVLTPTGWYQIGALLVGDQILDEHGNPQTVEAIYDQGTVPIFRITTEAGRTVEASADHLWQTEQEEDEGNVITTTDRLAPGIRIPVAALG